MKPETSRWADKARRDLAAARRDLDAGDPDNAVVRTYYAAFHAATAALCESGRAAKTHAGTQTLFFQTFVQDVGTFEPSLSRTLSRLQQHRESADYGVRAPDAETARESIEQATAFVDAVGAWLAGRPA